MQYRLSTIFLIFFFIAASLATFGMPGIWIAFFFLLAALSANAANSVGGGIIAFFLVGLLAIPGFLWPLIERAKLQAKESCSGCAVLQIGLALHWYLDTYKKFPPLFVSDSSGHPLRSWRVEVLPYMEYGSLYKALNPSEPWDSVGNKKVLDQFPNETQFTRRTCALEIADTPNTCYMAVVGPGTAWRSDGPVSLEDLPDRGSHTVMMVEVADSNVHWAAPRDLTVEEALEGLKTGNGLRISTNLKTRTNIFLADGSVRSLPTKMPLSLWKKLLAGELSADEIHNIQSLIDPDAPDMVDVSIAPKEFDPGFWGMVSALLVWLFAVVLLFRRAIKSRKKHWIDQLLASTPIV